MNVIKLHGDWIGLFYVVNRLDGKSADAGKPVCLFFRFRHHLVVLLYIQYREYHVSVC